MINRIKLSFLALLFIFGFISCGNNKTENVKSEEKTAIIDSISDINEITKKIRQNPESPDLFVKRAELQFQNNNVAEAINDMNIALVLDSLNTNYYVKIAEYYLHIGRSEMARDALLKSLQINPMNADARLKLAQIYFYVKMYNQAIREVNNLEANNLQSADSYFLKGLIYYEQEMFNEAIRAFRSTIDFDRNYWQAHNFLGLIHNKLENPLAVDFFETAVRLFPDNLEIRLNAGITFQDFKFPDKALEQYEYIISVDSAVYNAFFNKGYVYLELKGNYPKAIEAFTKAIELDETSYPAYYNRGFAYELMGNLNMAEANYRKALEIKPNYDLAVDGLNDVIAKQRSNL